MYAGRIMEQADAFELYAQPAHPYTKGLLDSIPRLDQKGETLSAIGGLPPNLMHIPPGVPSIRGAIMPKTSAELTRRRRCERWSGNDSRRATFQSCCLPTAQSLK
jgi:oligopeptide/dipeptide ABC transporter ATP-binding protein